MRRSLLLPLLALSVISMACSLTSRLAPSIPPTPGPASQMVATPPTSIAVDPTQIATAGPSPAAPTQPTDPPLAPTAASSSPANPPTTGPLSFTETFDEPNDHWSDPLIVTSQAIGHDPFAKISLDAGRMKFAIQDKETYVYEFFKPTLEGQSALTVTYEYRTLSNNGVALVCKADPGMTSWYEARLISEESKYSLYAYTQRKKDQNNNPYTLLAQGILTTKEFSPVKSNVVSLTCADGQLKLDLNNGLKVITQPVDGSLKGSQVGIGVMSFNSLPVNIDFKTVEIRSLK